MAEELSGFYYDLQKENELTRVTLHSNMEIKKSEEKKGGKGGGGSAEKKKIEFEKVSGDKDADGYSTKALCSCIMNEDFAMTIANAWSEMGGDPIGSLWNSFKPLAPYLDVFSDTIQEMKEKQDAWAKTQEGKKGMRNSSLVKGLGWVVDKLSSDKVTEGTSKASLYLNSALSVEGSRFSFYGGTGISFSNMVMKFTLFSEFGNTVSDQLKDLLPYFIGTWEGLDENEEAVNTLGKTVTELIGFERPPSGYRANIWSVDTKQDKNSMLKNSITGTFKLKFGPYYSIRNLVVSDLQLNFSKQMVKIPENEMLANETKLNLHPLFCDVQLTLKPCVKYNDELIEEFVLGSSTQEDRMKFEGKLEESLKGISDFINKGY